MKLTLLSLVTLVLGGAVLETAELRELSLSEQHEAAQVAAEVLTTSPEFLAAPERARAEAWFTVGVAQHRASAPQASLAAFLDARDLAGPGGTRLGAMYNLGTILLEQAEVVRATIPELAPPTPAQAPAAAPDEEAPDPLQVARAGYLGARQALVDRLRTEPEAGDTRANLELIVRRLRELDDLEQQREEQEQEQQDESEDQEESEGEDSEDGEQDQEQEPEEGDDEESEPQDQEQEEPSEEEQPPEEEEGDDSEGEPEEQPTPEESEELMTSEEIQRLMDRLAEIEEQARAVQAMLRRREHVPVEKDW